MSRRINGPRALNNKKFLLGQRFGRLLVISEIKDKHKRTVWICKCDCGKTTKGRHADRLLRGRSLSCGCLRIENQRNKDTKSLAYVMRYEQDKFNAKYRQLKFDLSKEDHKILISGHCYYCNLPPLRHCSPYLEDNGILKKGAKKNNVDINYAKSTVIFVNGIDRIDSNVGYILENCVPCCFPCNFAKSDRTQKEFIAWVKKIYHHTLKQEIKSFISNIRSRLENDKNNLELFSK